MIKSVDVISMLCDRAPGFFLIRFFFSRTDIFHILFYPSVQSFRLAIRFDYSFIGTLGLRAILEFL